MVHIWACIELRQSPDGAGLHRVTPAAVTSQPLHCITPCLNTQQ